MVTNVRAVLEAKFVKAHSLSSLIEPCSSIELELCSGPLPSVLKCSSIELESCSSRQFFNKVKVVNARAVFTTKVVKD